MSNWIENEGEKTRREHEARVDKEYLISMSNHWAALRDQIKADVEAINKDSNWQHLFGEKITTQQIDVGGLRLRKASFPAAFTVDITNGGDEIKIRTLYKLDTDHEYEEDEETLTVESERGHIIVKNRKGDSFLVPEKASEYILRGLIRAKNDSRTFFDKYPHLGR